MMKKYCDVCCSEMQGNSQVTDIPEINQIFAIGQIDDICNDCFHGAQNVTWEKVIAKAIISKNQSIPQYAEPPYLNCP